ncbi:hypothetical protein H5410_038416, partial [Solanum commersonii]
CPLVLKPKVLQPGPTSLNWESISFQTNPTIILHKCRSRIQVSVSSLSCSRNLNSIIFIISTILISSLIAL